MMWAELAMASWETIVHRTFLMMSGSCSMEEYQRMTAEKVEAFNRSAQILVSGRTGPAALALALRPWHGPATANAKRLRGK